MDGLRKKIDAFFSSTDQGSKLTEYTIDESFASKLSQSMWTARKSVTNVINSRLDILFDEPKKK